MRCVNVAARSRVLDLSGTVSSPSDSVEVFFSFRSRKIRFDNRTVIPNYTHSPSTVVLLMDTLHVMLS